MEDDIDYSELNDVEFSCANMPLDSFTDYDKEMALAANEHMQEEEQYVYCRRVKMSKVCEEWLRNNPRDDVSFREYIASHYGADVDDEYVYQPLSDEEVCSLWARL